MMDGWMDGYWTIGGFISDMEVVGTMRKWKRPIDETYEEDI